MALNITSSGGQQTATGNPQTVPTATPGSPAQSRSVQPGTSDSLLESQQGISLGNQSLTTVSLDGNPSQARTVTSTRKDPAAKPVHHVNAAWLSLPVLLVLVAAAMFWSMARSAKSTTN